MTNLSKEASLAGCRLPVPCRLNDSKLYLVCAQERDDATRGGFAWPHSVERPEDTTNVHGHFPHRPVVASDGLLQRAGFRVPIHCWYLNQCEEGFEVI
jgi:hypothetical protein